MSSEVILYAVQFIYSPAAQEALETSEIEYWEPGGDIFEGEEVVFYVKTQEDQEALVAAIVKAQEDDS